MTETTHPAVTRQRQPRKERLKPLHFARIENDGEDCKLVIRTVEQPSGCESTDRYTLENIGTDTTGTRGLALPKTHPTIYNITLYATSPSYHRKCSSPHN